MQRLPQSKTTHDGRRTTDHRGFTLVELMMVIAIIAFLIAVTWVALGNVLGGAKVKATQATIRKIDGLLTKRLEAMEREFERKGGSTSSVQGIVRRKQRMIALFPQTLEESSDPANNGTSQSPADASEAFYYFLTQTAVLDTEDLDSDMFTSTEVMDTDGDGNLEFVDAWEQPLRFYRWPTRLIRPALDPTQPQGVNPGPPASYTFPIDPNFSVFAASAGGANASVLMGNIPPVPKDALGNPRFRRGDGANFNDEALDPLAKDADDPLGFQEFTTSSGAADFEATYHTPETWSLPLIVSAGIDRELGLFEPYDETNHGNLAQPIPAELEALLDNITNRNLQAGGQ